MFLPPPVIMWSPNGDAVVVSTTLVHLGRAICRLPEGSSGGFLDSLHIFARLFGPREPTVYRFFGTDCAPLDTTSPWNHGEPSLIDDISIDRGFVCIRRVLDSAISIIAPFSGKTVQRWETHQLYSGSRFADSGKAICGGDGSGADEKIRIPLQCLDVDTGRVIAEAQSISGGAISTSERASRVLADDIARGQIPFGYEHGTVLKRRVIWDFKTRKEVVSWGPRTQSYKEFDSKEPFRSAISPDGQYVVEGGSGVLRLYKIEP